MTIASAHEILNKSIIHYCGEPVGTAAAVDPNPEAVNYHECFVRDFVPSALVFLMDGRAHIVRNFLVTVMQLRGQQPVLEGHQRSRGLMPASFKVVEAADGEQLIADFGERAIGRVVPVDSAMWWMLLLRAYVMTTDDWDFARSQDIQTCIQEILESYLRERFESSPTLLVPDGSFMILISSMFQPGSRFEPVGGANYRQGHEGEHDHGDESDPVSTGPEPDGVV